MKNSRKVVRKAAVKTKTAKTAKIAKTPKIAKVMKPRRAARPVSRRRRPEKAKGWLAKMSEFWVFGPFGSAALVAFGIWYAQKAPDAPRPLELPVSAPAAQVAPQAQVPVAA